MDFRKRKNEIELIDSDSNDSADLVAEGSSVYRHLYNVEHDSNSCDLDRIAAGSSDSEDEIDCDIWDSDCVIVPKEHRPNAIHGYYLIPTCAAEPHLEKKTKYSEEASLPASFFDSQFTTEFQNKWNKNMSYTFNSVELINNPFKICVIDNFLNETYILNEARKEMYETEWNKRNLDLYEFFQSKDLEDCEQKYIKKIYKFLKNDVMKWVSLLTGLALNKISATCSLYSKTDFLLVHDDLQEDRVIAFVLYITDPSPSSDDEIWTSQMGGALQLFDKDENGQPRDIVKNILPRNNRLIFFKVTNDSYHQVEEVLSMNHCRLSINGWFHTSNFNVHKLPNMEPPLKGLFSLERCGPQLPQVPFDKWVSPEYLKPRAKKQIQKQIERSSEISLQDFFNGEPYKQLCIALKNKDIKWKTVGPINRRKYEVITDENLPIVISEFFKIFQSNDMFRLLKDYTDLDLIEKGDMRPTMRYELQRWSPHCYSLLSEYDWKNENELDLIMYISCPTDRPVVGGRTMYISTDESIEDALVTLEPVDNTLNIVFRDTARITRHVSRSSYLDYFYIIICSYKE